MKIGQKSSIVYLESYMKHGQNGGAGKQPVQQAVKRSVPADLVKISNRAMEIINKAWEIVDATPEIREEMVGHFKRKMEAGSCAVKSEQVAEKMLKEFLLDGL
jgi:anti-sigma28 factor (negative regulator of flagellin synthesis)